MPANDTAYERSGAGPLWASGFLPPMAIDGLCDEVMVTKYLVDGRLVQIETVITEDRDSVSGDDGWKVINEGHAGVVAQRMIL